MYVHRSHTSKNCIRIIFVFGYTCFKKHDAMYSNHFECVLTFIYSSGRTTTKSWLKSEHRVEAILEIVLCIAVFTLTLKIRHSRVRISRSYSILPMKTSLSFLLSSDRIDSIESFYSFFHKLLLPTAAISRSDTHLYCSIFILLGPSQTGWKNRSIRSKINRLNRN